MTEATRRGLQEPTPAEPVGPGRPENAQLDDIIQAIAEIASTTEDPLETVLHHIADWARRLARAEYAAVGVPNPDGYLEQFVVSGIDDEEIRKIGHPPEGRGLLGALMRERRSIRIPNIAADPRSAGFPAHHPPMTSFLGVPIIWNDKVLGNLYLANKRDAPEFSAGDQKLIEALAAHAAVAIQNSRLYAEVRDLNHQLLRATREAQALAAEERQAREAAEALAGVARDVAAEVELPKLLDTLVSRTRDLTGADLASVVTVDQETGEIVWRAESGQRSPRPQVATFPPGTGLAGRVIAAKAPVIVHPGGDPEHPVEEYTVLVGEGTKVALGVPLTTAGVAFGVLIVGFRREHEFTEREVSLAKTLADHASVAIANARLVDSLRRVSQAREEEIKLISHDLRAPLTIILGQGQMLPRFVQAGNKEAANRACQAIVTGVKRMNALIQDLVDAARLESGRVELRRQPVDLVAFVNDLRTRLAGVVDPARIEIRADPSLPPVEVDAGRLERVFTNLLVNAVKYSPPDSSITVQLRRQEADHVLASVSDRGVGINPEQLPKLFQRFYRSQETASGEGLGLGLYITRKIVEAHGGRAWAESPGRGQGATFSFTLPTRSGTEAADSPADDSKAS